MPPVGCGGPLRRPQTGTSVFDPATLSLTGWWRASFAASPWVGTASAGTSGSNNLTEATNPPTVGSALNGLNPASFNGSTKQLTAGGTVSTYVSPTAYSGWALVNIAAIATDSGTGSPYVNDHVFADTVGGYFGLALRSTGPGIQAYHLDATTYQVAATTFTTSAWTLIQWRYDGTNIGVRVNSGSWVTQAAASMVAGAAGAGLRMGHNYNVSFLNGLVADAGLASSSFNDATFDQIKSYVNARYALAL
jgi:hypothetical protein